MPSQFELPHITTYPVLGNYETLSSTPVDVLCCDAEGERRLNGAPGPRTHNMAHKPPSGGPATHYPGNNPQGHFKPHPPNKLPPPNRLQGRLVHGTRRIEMVNHSGLANGYQSGSDEQGDVDYTRKPRNTDQFTRKGGGDEEEDNQLHSSSRGSLPKYGCMHQKGGWSANFQYLFRLFLC